VGGDYFAIFKRDSLSRESEDKTSKRFIKQHPGNVHLLKEGLYCKGGRIKSTS
jgi:hypothetical protein